MYLFDLVAFTVASLFVFIGIKRGFIEEIFHLAAMIGGFIGAYISYPLIFDLLHFLKTSNNAKTVIAFLLAYIGIVFIMIVLGWIIKKIVHFSLLGWLDMLLGGILGLAKALVIIIIFTLSVSLLPPSQLKTAFSSSLTYNLIMEIPLHLDIPKQKKSKKEDSYTYLKKSKESFNKFRNKIDTLKNIIDSL